MARGDEEQLSALSRDVAAVAALNDPTRLALYRFVVGSARLVSRDEAAEAVGIRREMAAFHLDRLANEGLLDVQFRRLSGRHGPGAGRPAKLYRRSARKVQVTLPQRRNELAARLLAEALNDKRSATESLVNAARTFGEALGEQARRDAGAGAGRRRLIEHGVAALAAWGYEPSLDDGRITLRNCPFDDLRDYPDVVCGLLNRALLEGVVVGLGADGVMAVFDPRPDQCCVVIRTFTPMPRGSASAS